MQEPEYQPLESNEEHTVLDGTFVFEGETHTLGSLLRDRLLKNEEEVIFAAYDIQHPLYRRVEVRVQTLEKDVREVVHNTITDIVGELDTFEEQLIALKKNS